MKKTKTLAAILDYLKTNFLFNYITAAFKHNFFLLTSSMFMEMFHSLNKKCVSLLLLTLHKLLETYTQQLIGRDHGPINYIDTKAKCRHLKNLPVKGILRQVFICLRPPPLL